VTYRAKFEGSALSQLKGLPHGAFDAMVERIDADLLVIFGITWIG
jgi:hypothetical protein